MMLYFRFQNVLKMSISFFYIILYFYCDGIRRENIINCNMTSAICVGKRNYNLVASAL